LYGNRVKSAFNKPKQTFIMKKISLIALLALLQLALFSCKKSVTGTDNFDNISSPRTNPVPAELVGRWAITGISGTTVYNIPSGSTHNSNEVFLGYQINPDGSIKQDGYISTYQYGVSSWTKWSAVGSVEIEGNSIAFHRVRGSYTSSRNPSPTSFGSAEIYPNKTSAYAYFEIGTDSRGNAALLLTNDEGATSTYVKQ
jgi:hypothetical protein